MPVLTRAQRKMLANQPPPAPAPPPSAISVATQPHSSAADPGSPDPGSPLSHLSDSDVADSPTAPAPINENSDRGLTPGSQPPFHNADSCTEPTLAGQSNEAALENDGPQPDTHPVCPPLSPMNQGSDFEFAPGSQHADSHRDPTPAGQPNEAALETDAPQPDSHPVCTLSPTSAPGLSPRVTSPQYMLHPASFPAASRCGSPPGSPVEHRADNGLSASLSPVQERVGASRARSAPLPPSGFEALHAISSLRCASESFVEDLLRNPGDLSSVSQIDHNDLLLQSPFAPLTVAVSTPRFTPPPMVLEPSTGLYLVQESPCPHGRPVAFDSPIWPGSDDDASEGPDSMRCSSGDEEQPPLVLEPYQTVSNDSSLSDYPSSSERATSIPAAEFEQDLGTNIVSPPVHEPELVEEEMSDISTHANNSSFASPTTVGMHLPVVFELPQTVLSSDALSTWAYTPPSSPRPLCHLHTPATRPLALVVDGLSMEVDATLASPRVSPYLPANPTSLDCTVQLPTSCSNSRPGSPMDCSVTWSGEEWGGIPDVQSPSVESETADHFPEEWGGISDQDDSDTASDNGSQPGSISGYQADFGGDDSEDSVYPDTSPTLHRAFDIKHSPAMSGFVSFDETNPRSRDMIIDSGWVSRSSSLNPTWSVNGAYPILSLPSAEAGFADTGSVSPVHSTNARYSTGYLSLDEPMLAALDDEFPTLSESNPHVTPPAPTNQGQNHASRNRGHTQVARARLSQPTDGYLSFEDDSTSHRDLSPLRSPDSGPVLTGDGYLSFEEDDLANLTDTQDVGDGYLSFDEEDLADPTNLPFSDGYLSLDEERLADPTDRALDAVDGYLSFDDLPEETNQGESPGGASSFSSSNARDRSAFDRTQTLFNRMYAEYNDLAFARASLVRQYRGMVAVSLASPPTGL